MYAPLPGKAEYLELLNLSHDAVDLSGWVVSGCSFTFPPGTHLAAGALALLADTNHLSAEQFRASNNVPADVMLFGHLFVLENEGERLKLERPNTEVPTAPYVMESLRYNDKSPWPTEADGEGPSLERYAAEQFGDDPINWRTVSQGGSPGRPNQFPAGIAITKESRWKYHSSGANLGTVWCEPGYSDTSWPGGDGSLGYGTEGLTTLLPEGSLTGAKPLTAYLRKDFVVNDPQASIAALHLEAMYDDGFVVYLNGTEVARSASMPAGTITSQTPAAVSYNSIGYETFDLSAHIHLLQLGRNQLAVELHQESPESPDLLWDASLEFDVTTIPRLPTPKIEPAAGVYYEPVTLTLSNEIPDTEIYYTLNGTAPDSTATRYSSPIQVNGSVAVRARAYKACHYPHLFMPSLD